MGGLLSGLLLDTHVAYWLLTEPDRLSRTAQSAIDNSEDVAVAAISWYEIGWLADHDRLRLGQPTSRWVDEASSLLRTVPLDRDIAVAAGALPDSIGGDPVDRLIYATASQLGMQLVTKDRRLRGYRGPRKICIW